MKDNEFETKGNKIKTNDNIEPYQVYADDGKIVNNDSLKAFFRLWSPPTAPR